MYMILFNSTLLTNGLVQKLLKVVTVRIVSYEILCQFNGKGS